jgi:LmbE family N-acetylglucosaminyl deacetylase
MNTAKTLSALLLLSFSIYAQSAFPPKPDDRYKADLLVVVAHPDDETAITGYLARAIFDQHKRVAVVFGTHGNSGGNAEGQEQAGALGAIRDIEARRAVASFDIANVWFLNGPDTPGQDVLRSLETWNHGQALDQLVRLIRLTRPFVIATWLPDYVASENHGDHQAAGVLATEAFDMAGDPSVYSEQIEPPRNKEGISNLTEGLHPWQPEKIYFFTDALQTDFLEGKGPKYSATESSVSKHATYARLAAEECSFHLTQSDTGQMARNALATNDLRYFEQPVRFVLGKSYVDAKATADLFEGVVPSISYVRYPGYVPRELKTGLSFGGPIGFYRTFWQAHGLEHLSNLVPPEVMVAPSSTVTIPVKVENADDSTLNVSLKVLMPPNWQSRKSVTQFTVGPHSAYTAQIWAISQAQPTKDWQFIKIAGTSENRSLGELQMRAQVDEGALPQ